MSGSIPQAPASAKAAINSFCEVLRENGVSCLDPEAVRQAKFDGPVSPLLWRALHDLSLMTVFLLDPLDPMTSASNSTHFSTASKAPSSAPPPFVTRCFAGVTADCVFAAGRALDEHWNALASERASSSFPPEAALFALDTLQRLACPPRLLAELNFVVTPSSICPSSFPSSSSSSKDISCRPPPSLEDLDPNRVRSRPLLLALTWLAERAQVFQRAFRIHNMDLDPDRDVTSWLPPLPEDTCTSAAALRARAAAEEATRVHFSRIHDLIGSFAPLNPSSLSSTMSSAMEGEKAERKSNRRGGDVAKTGNDGVVFGMEDLGRSWGAVDCAAHHVVKALGKIRCAVASLEATLESRIHLQEEIYRLQRNFLNDREDQKFHRQQAGSSINDFSNSNNNNSSNHTYNSQLPPALPVLSPYEIHLAVRDPKSLDEHVAAITKATAAQRRQADLLDGGQLYMAWAHSVLLLEKQYMEKQGRGIGRGVVSSDQGRGGKGGVGMPNIANDLSTRGIDDLANPSTATRTASLSHAKGKKTKGDKPRWDGDAFGSHPEGLGDGGIGNADADDEMKARRNMREATTTTTTPPPPPAAWDPEFGGDEIGSKIRRGELQKLLPYMEAAKAAKAVKAAKAIKVTKVTKVAETIPSSHTGNGKSNRRMLNENNEQNGQNGQSLALLPVLSHLHSRLSAESQKWLDPEFKQALLATTRVVPKGIQNLAGSLLQIPDPKDARANQLRRHLDDQLDRLVDILHPYLAAAAAAAAAAEKRERRRRGEKGGAVTREGRGGEEGEGEREGKGKKRYDRGNRENKEGRDGSFIELSSPETEINWDDVEILAAQTLGISDPDFGSSRIEVEEEASRDGGGDDAESASTLRQIHPKELKGDGDRKGGKYHQTKESCLAGEGRAKCTAHLLSTLRHPLIASYLQLLSSSSLPSSSLPSTSTSTSPLTYDCFPDDVSEILFAFTELKRQRLTVLERNRLVALLSKQASLVSYKFSDPPIAPSYNNGQISHNNDNSNGITNMDNTHGGGIPGKYTKATEEAAAVAVAALEVARALAKVRASNRKALISAVQDGVLPPSVVVEGLGE